MLALQANHHVKENKLVRGCIVRLKQFTPNNHKGKK
jgi:replication factor A1